jgi:hypothetical protein
MNLDELRYPIGRYEPPTVVGPGDVRQWIDEIEAFPATLRAVVDPLTPAQLETPYRPGGWRVSQVVHHLADSHMNSYLRFKWALTEDRPTIKPYAEERWAELHDSAATPVAVSLRLLEALHARWVVLLRGMSPEELKREFVHPESGTTRLESYVALYAWHGRHHGAHIVRLAEREGWLG